LFSLKQNERKQVKNLTIGDKAPFFEGVIEDGKKISLDDFKGNKLVLYFYPKDMTPGCTAQACDLTSNYELFLEKNYKIVGVSADSVARHEKFKEKYSIPFPLIADEDHTILNAYGVWGPKKFMGREYDGIHRTTFIINEEGLIERIIEKVKTKEHTKQILND
jgi:peroxiredoxin Q/BCP